MLVGGWRLSHPISKIHDLNLHEDSTIIEHIILPLISSGVNDW